MKRSELKDFLDEMTDRYNVPGFIEFDPISIPHQFLAREDIEISGFLTAILSWGQRVVILKNCNRLMNAMDNRPYEFIMQASKSEVNKLDSFVHRTFNGRDAIYFVYALRNIYRNHGGLEQTIAKAYFESDHDFGMALSQFRKIFISLPDAGRTQKHISDPMANSAAKRICMFLRWMVRKDSNGVDFGIWDKIPMSALHSPLDLHSARVARKFHLLKRKQDDWKSVVELTSNLRKMDPNDPVKYDFALFGLGVNAEF